MDVSYWFDKSTKRKAGLEKFCIFCDTTYKEVIAHVSTRWLCLEQAINRILQLYVSLASYFKSTSEYQARFGRLQKRFADPTTEIYLLFYQSVIPVLTRLNQLLQRGDPLIYLLYSQMRAFLKNLISRFVKPQYIVGAGDDITKISYDEPNVQLDDNKVHISMFTRSKLKKLLEEGDIRHMLLANL